MTVWIEQWVGNGLHLFVYRDKEIIEIDAMSVDSYETDCYIGESSNVPSDGFREPARWGLVRFSAPRLAGDVLESGSMSAVTRVVEADGLQLEDTRSYLLYGQLLKDLKRSFSGSVDGSNAEATKSVHYRSYRTTSGAFDLWMSGVSLRQPGVPNVIFTPHDAL